jgi:hypothetical protein
MSANLVRGLSLALFVFVEKLVFKIVWRATNRRTVLSGIQGVANWGVPRPKTNYENI